MYAEVKVEKRLHEKERRVFVNGREFASIITEGIGAENV